MRRRMMRGPSSLCHAAMERLAGGASYLEWESAWYGEGWFIRLKLTRGKRSDIRLKIGGQLLSDNKSKPMQTSIITSLLLSLALQAGLPAEEIQKHESTTLGDYNLEQALDHAELIRLAKIEKRDFDENRQLWQMIVHAGIKNDDSLKVLLDDKKLRASDSSVDLALSAYDYMINKDERALDHILAFLATERVGEDTDTIIILSAVNEWDRSIKAFKKHFYVTDGAGGANYSGFLAVRGYLYPDLYLKHKEEIEADPRG